MSENIYSLHKVKKIYDDKKVLHIDRLEIYRGEVFSLVGPSGAGKSTLLRLLNFLEPPSSGQIKFIDGEFSSNNPIPLKYRRRVTTVFQRPILLNRSVQANISYGLNLRGDLKSNGEIDKALQQVGLKSLSRQRARTLSGGEAQRVALARAIVLKPDVLLLDEPTANLDPYNIGLIEDIVMNLNREKNTTLVLVTHNVFQAKRLADRVALMLDGNIVEVANVNDFFESPQDERTAAFVRGDMIY
ncbi:MAG: ATP-binding cassette domain-containing protein [Gammaproteobacteria bacterium]|nr:phosphate ABC transporter ATP-binding protein [candidate division Zixibacteria bacterium]NIX17173.1 ATP-binding cassette domain-containing protein [Gammaproteobacteria bacterium]